MVTHSRGRSGSYRPRQAEPSLAQPGLGADETDPPGFRPALEVVDAEPSRQARFQLFEERQWVMRSDEDHAVPRSHGVQGAEDRRMTDGVRHGSCVQLGQHVAGGLSTTTTLATASTLGGLSALTVVGSAEQLMHAAEDARERDLAGPGQQWQDLLVLLDQMRVEHGQ